MKRKNPVELTEESGWVGDYRFEDITVAWKDAIDWKQLGYNTKIVKKDEKTCSLFIEKVKNV